MAEQSAYPLSWPVGWKRTPAHERVAGSFDGTPDKVRREMVLEIDRIALGRDARTQTIRNYMVISTNVPLRRDGEPMAGRNEPVDPGVAVYFKRNGKPVCFACDRFDRVWKNMRAIQRTVEALRGIERWGSSQLLERAFQGFAALPERTETESCWSILGIPAGSTRNAIMVAWREKAKLAHPDVGGTTEAMAKLNQAKEEAWKGAA